MLLIRMAAITPGCHLAITVTDNATGEVSSRYQCGSAFVDGPPLKKKPKIERLTHATWSETINDYILTCYEGSQQVSCDPPPPLKKPKARRVMRKD